MNKIYLDPIGKSKMLIEGVEKQRNLLAGKGVKTDTAALAEACRQLEEAGHKQEAIEEELKRAREEAHRKLDTLKELYTEFKAPIKQSFAPETWSVFGIPDKK